MGVPYAEVIGDPVAHSKSPLIHKFWLAKLGLEGDYRATRVAADELPIFLARRRDDEKWCGCNVTMPHKVRAWRLLQRGALGSHEGAVNCIVRGVAGLEGHNFDVDALMRTIPQRQARGRVIIMGSGGAARAVRDALSAEAVILLARNETEARSLMIDEGDRWCAFDEADRALRGGAGLINATPLGMTGMEAMPNGVLGALHRLRKGAFVFDMVYEPTMTTLIAEARALGMATQNGMPMLIEQAGLSFRRFFGVRAPREHDAELRARLTS